MSSDQMPAPGKIKLIKFPPPGQEKTSNARGMPGVCPGGMLKLRFDWYITTINRTKHLCVFRVKRRFQICPVWVVNLVLFCRSYINLLWIHQLQLKEVHVVFFISKLWESVVEFLQTAAHIAFFLKNDKSNPKQFRTPLNTRSSWWKQRNINLKWSFFSSSS